MEIEHRRIIKQSSQHSVKIRPFRYGNIYLPKCAYLIGVVFVKIRPFRYGNRYLDEREEKLYQTMLKSDRFGMEI